MHNMRGDDFSKPILLHVHVQSIDAFNVVLQLRQQQRQQQQQQLRSNLPPIKFRRESSRLDGAVSNTPAQPQLSAVGYTKVSLIFALKRPCILHVRRRSSAAERL